MLGRVVVATFVVFSLVFVFGSPAVGAEIHSGVIKNVEEGKFTLTVTVDDASKDIVFMPARDAKITLNGKDAKWEDLKAGQRCSVNAEKNDEDELVARVIVARSAE